MGKHKIYGRKSLHAVGKPKCVARRFIVFWSRAYCVHYTEGPNAWKWPTAGCLCSARWVLIFTEGAPPTLEWRLGAHLAHSSAWGNFPLERVPLWVVTDKASCFLKQALFFNQTPNTNTDDILVITVPLIWQGHGLKWGGERDLQNLSK